MEGREQEQVWDAVLWRKEYLRLNSQADRENLHVPDAFLGSVGGLRDSQYADPATYTRNVAE
jgi:hypothetical protein